MIKFVIAVVLSAALLWSLPKHDTPVNNLGSKAAITKPAGQVHQSVTAPAQEVKQVEAPTAQKAKTQPEIEKAVATVPQPTTHEQMMAAAGIQPADYGAADYIISHESGW